jgi:hypothetical protein
VITKGAFILFVSAYKGISGDMFNSKNDKKNINYVSYISVTRDPFCNRVSDNVRRFISDIFFLFIASIC